MLFSSLKRYMYLFVKRRDTVSFHGSMKEGKLLLITTKNIEMAEYTRIFP